MIADNDPRWVWDMDPRQSFGALTAYRGNRQVSDMVWANWTDPGVLPVNDGVNQTFERVLDPEGSGQYVYRLQIHKDRAVGSAYLPGTWRSEVSNTMDTPEWDTEYWLAVAVRLADDWAAPDPLINIFEFHVPYPQPNPVAVSPFYMLCGSGNFRAVVRYNAGYPSNQNDYTVARDVSIAATRNVWHYFVINFRLGADNPANFLRLWHAQGSGALNQIIDYTGRIGYDSATTARSNFAKHGLYYWDATWPSGSTSRTMWTKGFRLIRAAAGTPTLNQNEMLALMREAGGVPEPEPEPAPPWTGVPIAAVTRFATTDDESSRQHFGAIAGDAPDSSQTGYDHDLIGTEGHAMLIKTNETTAARRTVYVQLTKTSDGTAYTAPLATSDLKISKAGGAEANSDGTATHLGGGCYKYVLTTDEVGTLGAGYVRVAQATCYARMYPFQVVAFDPMSASSLGLSNLDTTVSSNAPANMATALLDLTDGIETGMTPRQALRFIASILGGQTEGADTNSEKFLAAVANHKIRATVTLVGSDRSNVAVDLD
jgi:hypothetical protein